MSGFELPPLSPSVPRAPRLIGEAPRSAGDGERAGAASGFGQALAAELGDVSKLQQQVADDTKAIALGDNVGVDRLMLSIGKSEVAFNLMLEVRNKLVDAWEKLSRSVV